MGEDIHMRPLIVGNWKMHGLRSELAEIVAVAACAQVSPLDADVLICPPATLIAEAVLLAKAHIAIGGQDCRGEPGGAFTGDIAAEMLKDAGASAVIVGHSERRRGHGETDAIVATKAKAAWRAGLLAIICIGESEVERSAGRAFLVSADQISGSVPEGARADSTVIAYEPLWAIGTGRTATLDEIAQMHSHIRRSLISRLGQNGGTVRILYGGSVDPLNARAILAVPHVSGALVGGASLRADDFKAIVRAIPAVAA